MNCESSETIIQTLIVNSKLAHGFAMKENSLFHVVPLCTNANVTAKVFGYAMTSYRTALTLLRISKASRFYLLKHGKGAI